MVVHIDQEDINTVHETTDKDERNKADTIASGVSRVPVEVTVHTTPVSTISKQTPQQGVQFTSSSVIVHGTSENLSEESDDDDVGVEHAPTTIQEKPNEKSESMSVRVGQAHEDDTSALSNEPDDMRSAPYEKCDKIRRK